jgi:hypothetical protein
MSTRVIQLEMDEDLYGELKETAERLELGRVEDALRAAAADWLARRRAEMENRGADERYFVNQALDELMAKKR